MTHLNIQQGLNVEVVSTNLIKKLYEAALSVPEPLEGELDAAYLSGNLLVDKSYRSYVEYLTNRFDDLHINVTAGYYIPFHDSAVNDVLKNTIGDGTGVLDTLFSAVTDLNSLGLVNNTNITDFREGVLLDNASIATSAGFVNGCTNLDVVGVPPYLTRWGSLITYGCAPSKIVISNWNNWVYPILVASGQGLCYIKHDLCTLNADNSLSTVTSINLPEGVDFPSGHMMFGGFYNSTINTVNIPTTVTRLNSFLRSDIQTLTFTQESTLTSIELYCFYECSNLVFDVANLPLTITTIGDNAFRSCSNVTGALNLPNLISLESCAFLNSKITSVIDLGNITTIPDSCFRGCTSITSVTLPSTCTSIGTYGFADCNMSTIDLSNVTIIGTEAFVNCKSLTSVTFSTSPISIKNGAFSGCTNLTGNVEITLSDQYFPVDLFENSKISKLIVHGSNLASYTSNIGNSYHGWLMLPACTYIDLSDTLITLGVAQNCALLTTIIFPTTIDTLSYNMGVACPNLLYYIILSTTPPSTIPSTLWMFTGNNMPNANIYVPDSALTAWKTAFSTIESRIKGISELPSDITWSTKQ